MAVRPIRLLLVEDNEGDARYVRETLREMSNVRIHHLDRFEACLQHLAAGEVDVVLLDLGLPDSQGLDTLRAVVKANPATPVVVFTGLDDEEAGQAAVREGAQDYLVKGHLAGDTLARTLRFAIERKQGQRALDLSNQHLSRLNAVASRLAAAPSREDVYALVAREVKGLTGGASGSFARYHRRERCLRVEHLELDRGVDGDLPQAPGGSPLAEAPLPLSDELLRALVQTPISYRSSLSEAAFGAVPGVLASAVQRLQGIDRFLGIAYVQGGELFGTSLVALRAGTPDPPGELVHSFAEMVAVSLRRVRVEAERELLSTAIEQAAEMVCITDAQGAIIYANPALARVTGYTRAELLGQNPRLFKSGAQDAAFYLELWRTLSAGRTFHGRMVNKKKDGTLYTEDATISPVRSRAGVTTSYVAVKRDITQELETEAQLLQAQKMEGIGRLAGGVAHDFNNLLSVILSYTGFALEGLPPGDPRGEDLQEVQKAGERAAALIRQLLAFSRRQILQPAPLDLNRVVASIEKMLRRIVGEDIELVTVAASDLGLTVADPGQMEQVLMNLVVNARDAMPAGGKLIIETANVEIGEEYAAHHVSVKPGPYVQLVITDTGCGMDEQTRAQIFEPFFTTKERGKGTGLGLATAYGIVRQSGGNIWVYSELGQGTTFKVYLPRDVSGLEASVTTSPRGSTPRGGTETILVVEDEEALRQVARRALEEAGYTVLTAADGAAALLAAGRHQGTIHLLLTDVVMPGIGGRVLAQRLLNERPALRVLYMSGYTDNAIVHHGVLDAGTHFLAKPFTAADVVRRVRELLDGPAAGRDPTIALEAGEGAPRPDRDAVQRLPPDVLRRLHAAVIKVRYDEIFEVIAALDGSDPHLAAGLRQMAERFDYEGLRQLLQP